MNECAYTHMCVNRYTYIHACTQTQKIPFAYRCMVFTRTLFFVYSYLSFSTLRFQIQLRTPHNYLDSSFHYKIYLYFCCLILFFNYFVHVRGRRNNWMKIITYLFKSVHYCHMLHKTPQKWWIFCSIPLTHDQFLHADISVNYSSFK